MYTSQSTGFEPVRAEPNGFLVHRLNHSATTAMHVFCLQVGEWVSEWYQRLTAHQHQKGHNVKRGVKWPESKQSPPSQSRRTKGSSERSTKYKLMDPEIFSFILRVCTYLASYIGLEKATSHCNTEWLLSCPVADIFIPFLVQVPKFRLIFKN